MTMFFHLVTDTVFGSEIWTKSVCLVYFWN